MHRHYHNPAFIEIAVVIIGEVEHTERNELCLLGDEAARDTRESEHHGLRPLFGCSVTRVVHEEVTCIAAASASTDAALPLYWRVCTMVLDVRE